MDFTHGRREIKFSSEEEDKEEDTKSNFLGPPSSSSSSSSNHGGGFRRGGPSPPEDASVEPVAPPVEREHMFDKVVTPSDVGKLNRLVLPKQHAEKYFPLDSIANEKGLLLNFEDRTGKPWQFRYSYWNSSQSYVMTKGWSRFVKEKHLDAGDIVSFGRGVGEAGRDRLFIDWKHRPEALINPGPRGLSCLSTTPGSSGSHRHGYPLMSFNQTPLHPCGSRLFVPPAAAAAYDHHTSYGCNSAFPCIGGEFLYFPSTTAVPLLGVQHSGVGDGKASMHMVLDSVPVAHSTQAAPKRVRLFGVNLDCAPDSDGGHTYNGSVPPPQRTSKTQHMLSLPHLQLRLGGDDTSLSDSHHHDKQHLSSQLDLDL